MKILKKAIIILFPVICFCTICFILIVALVSMITGKSLIDERNNSMREKSNVINNQIYVDKYTNLLNKYLVTDGYVTLERLVFYLQRTNNILDTSKLSDELWEDAYLKNVNSKEKQMIPIKTICKDLRKQDLPFTIDSGENEDGLSIDVIHLCNVNGEYVAESKNYDENYYPLPYSFPLKTSFSVTSIVFEFRNVDFETLSEEEQEQINYHSGWDFFVPVGTPFYSICDGVVTDIVNTQVEDIPFSESNNKTGNYMVIKCSNGLSANYHHLKYKSQPDSISVGTIVLKGTELGKTSMTGESTGPHLHLGLRDSGNNILDALAYINFIEESE